MFCRFCGATMPEGAAFCRNCGKTLKHEAKPAQTMQPVQARQPVQAMQPAPGMQPAPVAHAANNRVADVPKKTPVLAIMIVLTSLMTVFTAGCFLYYWT